MKNYSDDKVLNELVCLKVQQAIEIMNEINLDVWLIPTQEMGDGGDPIYPIIYGEQDLGRGFLLLSRTGRKIAIVGKLDQSLPLSGGVWNEVYVHEGDLKSILVDVLNEIKPKTIGINYSKNYRVADGLSYGGFLKIIDYLSGSPFRDRLVSAEDLILRLRGRKNQVEIDLIRESIKQTDQIFSALNHFLRAGISGKEIHAFMLDQVCRAGLHTAWSKDHCPVVTVGPMPSMGHTSPGENRILPGQVLQIDFGVRYHGYCSDFQRMYYFLKKDEIAAPNDVVELFETVQKAIEVMKELCQPGTPTWVPPKEARKVMDDAGYPAYVYPGGHHLGRMAHDGGVGLGKYQSDQPDCLIESGNVLTVEGLETLIEGRGWVSLEEDVYVTKDGPVYLTEPQHEIYLVPYR
jgi:Xaa-Pro aminopeptidase